MAFGELSNQELRTQEAELAALEQRLRNRFGTVGLSPDKTSRSLTQVTGLAFRPDGARLEKKSNDG